MKHVTIKTLSERQPDSSNKVMGRQRDRDLERERERDCVCGSAVGEEKTLRVLFT